MALKLSKIMTFLHFAFCKTVIAIYVYASESSPFAVLENGVGYYSMI